MDDLPTPPLPESTWEKKLSAGGAYVSGGKPLSEAYQHDIVDIVERHVKMFQIVISGFIV